MKQFLRLFIFLDIILLSLVKLTAQDLYQPNILSVKQDDRAATLYWNSKTDTYHSQYDPDKNKGIYGYLIEWGKVGEGYVNRQVTPYRSFMVQPLEPGEIYQARVYNMDAYGKLSSPSTAISFQHSSARVDVMRAKLNGFFDDFNQPMGPFSERDWNQAYSGCMEVGTVSQHINNQYHAHNVIKSGACDRGVASSRLRHVFDFRDRTGTIEFDTDGSKLGRQLWYLDLSPANRKRDLSGHTSLDLDGGGPGADPAYLLRFQESGDKFFVALGNAEGQLIKLPNQYQNGACGNGLEFCNGENLSPLMNVRRRYRILLSKETVKVFINEILVVDASLQTDFTPDGLPYEEAQINWLFFSYNTTKENIPAAMIHWDNFGIDAPFGYQQSAVIHNYTDGKLGTEVPRTGNDPSAGMVALNASPATAVVPIPDQLTDTDGQSPLKTELMFTLQGGVYSWSAQDKVVVNGNEYLLPQPGSLIQNLAEEELIAPFRPYSVVLDIDPTHLTQGDNQIDFALNNGRILNVHIELTFPSDKAPSYTEPMGIFDSHMSDLMAFKQKIAVGPGIKFDVVDAVETWQDEFERVPTESGGLAALRKKASITGATLAVKISGNSDAQLASTGKAKGITHYEILLDDVVVQTIRVDTDHAVAAFVHKTEVDISGLMNGEHELFVRAYDVDGGLSVADYFQAAAYPARPIPIIFTVEGSTVSIDPSLDEKIRLYPNPTEGQTLLKWEPVLGIQKVMLTDVWGKLIDQQQVDANKNEVLLDIEGASGIYFVRVITHDQSTYTFKLSKQ
ncbi:MAG: T9SS type A sorting domain-containing protein [Bacteroidota bacterium]